MFRRRGAAGAVPTTVPVRGETVVVGQSPLRLQTAAPFFLGVFEADVLFLLVLHTSPEGCQQRLLRRTIPVSLRLSVLQHNRASKQVVRAQIRTIFPLRPVVCSPCLSSFPKPHHQRKVAVCARKVCCNQELGLRKLLRQMGQHRHHPFGGVWSGLVFLERSARLKSATCFAWLAIWAINLLHGIAVADVDNIFTLRMDDRKNGSLLLVICTTLRIDLHTAM